jgi:hypothetical protein
MDEKNEACPAGDQKLFFGPNALNEFCAWLFALKKKVIAIAHNASGYDGQFVLEYLQKNSMEPPQVITRGLQLIKIDVGNIRLIDSLNFIPCALDRFPGAFGITEAKKGFFPYFFIREANFNYNGQIPSKEDFCSKRMSEKKAAEFELWYAEASQQPFDFKKELIEYIESDTLLLKVGCIRFRQQFKEISKGIDPFKV